ncbi:MAG TPA: DNA-binding protein [Thermoanaerobaculia bacterium]
MSSVEVVCDAGPLIHLDELSSLDLLGDFRSVLIPDQVWEEVVRHRPEALKGTGFKPQRCSIETSADSRFQSVVKTFSLDAGEQAALSLMESYPGAVLLTDDAAARLAAKALGYRAHGSIGVLLRAIRRGLRSRAEIAALLRQIPFASTLHIRQSLLDEILDQVERAG